MQHRHFIALTALALLCSIAAPRPARAQSGVAVVVAGVSESSLAEAEADAFRAALSEQGETVMSPADLRTAYTATGTPAAPVSAAELAELRANQDAAVRALARAQVPAARERLSGTLDFLSEHIESLARSEEGATEALDQCLTVVRAFQRRRRKMRAAVTRCRQLFPNAIVTGFTHPPEIRRAFARTIDTPRVPVTVRGEREGCRVRLNGRPVGETPAVLELPAGSHRVQVECDDQVGRVHHVSVNEDPVDYTARAPISSARETPDLVLRYVNWGDLGRRTEDAAQLSSIAGLASVYLVSESSGQVTIEHIEGGRVLASQAYTPSEGARQQAFAALTGDAPAQGIASSGSDGSSAGSPTDAALTTTVDPVNAAPDGASVSRPTSIARRIPSQTRTFGFIGLALSAGAIGGAIGFWIRQGELGDEYASTVPSRNDFLPRQRAFRDARIPVYALAGAGAGIGILSVMMALPRVSRIPWWSWLVGGVGVALVAAGGVMIGLADGCDNLAVDRASCVSRQDNVSLGAVLALSSLPFLTVPLQFLIQRRLPEHTTLSVGPQGLSFTMQF